MKKLLLSLGISMLIGWFAFVVVHKMSTYKVIPREPPVETRQIQPAEPKTEPPAPPKEERNLRPMPGPGGGDVIWVPSERPSYRGGGPAPA